MDRIEVFSAVHKVNNQIKRNLDKVSAKHGITAMQACFLKYIYDKTNEGCDVFQKDFEQFLDLRRSSISEMVTIMEKRKYLKRVAIDSDKRMKKLVLTEEGEKVHLAVHANMVAYKERLLENFSDQEIDWLYSFLDKIAEKMED